MSYPSTNGTQTVRSVSGTPQFIAPEVLTGRRGGLGADVWALGVLMVHIATDHAEVVLLPGQDRVPVNQFRVRSPCAAADQAFFRRCGFLDTRIRSEFH